MKCDLIPFDVPRFYFSFIFSFLIFFLFFYWIRAGFTISVCSLMYAAYNSKKKQAIYTQEKKWLHIEKQSHKEKKIQIKNCNPSLCRWCGREGHSALQDASVCALYSFCSLFCCCCWLILFVSHKRHSLDENYEPYSLCLCVRVELTACEKNSARFK